MGVIKRLAVLVVIGFIAASCTSGSSAQDTVAAAETTEEVVEESTTTTDDEPDAIPEIADAIRPTLEIPDSDSYNNPVAEVIARYTLYQQTRYIAAGPPIADPEHEPIDDLMTGDVEELFRDLMTKLRNDNVVLVVEEEDSVTYSPEVLSPVVKKVEGATVIVEDCIVDNSYIQDRASGEVIEARLRTRQLTVELIFEDGQWRVRNSNINHKYEGESSCPERT